LLILRFHCWFYGFTVDFTILLLKSTIWNGKINSETVKSTNVQSKINLCTKSEIIRKKIVSEELKHINKFLILYCSIGSIINVSQLLKNMNNHYKARRILRINCSRHSFLWFSYFIISPFRFWSFWRYLNIHLQSFKLHSYIYIFKSV
jgi:hypothetical protein